MTNLFYRVSELERQINTLVRMGKVIDADYEQARVHVDCAGSEGWYPFLTHRAGGNQSWHPPEVGEQVMVFCPAGHVERGYVLPALYQDQYPAPAITPDVHRTIYKDGAMIEYDRATHVLKVSLPEGGRAVLTGDLEVDGSITATGDITDRTRSMAGDRAIYNGHNHTGDSGGKTSSPDQSQ